MKENNNDSEEMGMLNPNINMSDLNFGIKEDWLDKLHESVFEKNSLLIPINNKGGGKVDLCIIGSGGQSGFHPISSINTDNSIAVWYALKTTIDYLKNRSKIKISNEKRKRLDKAAAINLKSMSEYLGDGFGSKLEEGKKNDNINNNNIINTDNKNGLNVDNENIQQNGPVDINNVLNDMDKLAKAASENNFDKKKINKKNENKNTNDIIIEDNNNIIDNDIDNESVNDILQKYQNLGKSIDDVVFDKLIKEKASVENKNNIDDIINNNDNDKVKILKVLSDFEQLKEEIKEENKKEEEKDEIEENINTDKKIDYEKIADERDKKVFLSRAAKEFKDKVSKLKDVEDSKTRDQLIDDYNKAVEKLDNAIMEAVKEKIKNNRNAMAGGYHKDQLSNIFTALGLNSINGNDIKPNKKGKKKKKLGDDNGLDGEIQQIMDGVKDDCITGDNEKKLLNMLSKHLKKKLVMARSNGERQNCVKEFCPEDEKMSTSVSEALEVFIKQFSNLPDVDRNEISTSGEKIKQKENKGNKKNVNDLKAIANNEELEKITQGFDEYSDFVSKKLFGDVTDVNGAIQNFLRSLLLTSNSDEFQKAKGQMDGIAAKVHKEVEILKEQDQGDKSKGKYLQHVLALGLSSHGIKDIKNESKKFFVPTFIEGLFRLNSKDQLNSLVNNLNTLSGDKSFQSLLSDIMEDDFAVDMIKNNLEETEKLFKNAGYSATRRYKFKQEFWDNNLKGNIPFFGNSKNKLSTKLIMFACEGLVGYAGGYILVNKIASALGFSLATSGALPFIAVVFASVVTMIAIAVLASLVMTLFKGFMDLKKGDGFYKPSEPDKSRAQKNQTEYLCQIYTAFLTFGADEKKLGKLVEDSKKQDFNKKSPKGKFFKSMVDMKEFLKKNAKGDLKIQLMKSKPFSILEKGDDNNQRNLIK